MELLKHISLGLGSIILQREYVSIYSSWTVHSDTPVLLFLGTGHSFPTPFEKPPRPHLAIPADESAVTVPFITNSLGSLEVGGPAKLPGSQLPKPSPVLAATAPTTFWSCPLLVLCLFLCEWSSECGSFCTNHLFNMPAFIGGPAPAPFLPSLLAQVCKKAFIIILIPFVFLFFSYPYLPLKLSLTQQILTLLPSIFLSTNGCLTPCYQMLYL